MLLIRTIRLTLILLTCLASTARAQQISTIAGGGPFTGATATNASFATPVGIAFASNGDYYFSSSGLHAIYRVHSGTVTLIAGTPGRSGSSGDGSAATSAFLNSPNGIVLDGSGNLYIADSSNHRIRRVDAVTGLISTVAGTGTSGYLGDSGQATSARVNSPRGLAIDSSGNLFIADANNHRIRKVATDGVISTVAGNGTPGYLGDNVSATGTRLNSPRGVAVDSSGNLYIADTSNNRIRKVSSGTITTVAGTGTGSYSGDSGAATAATIRSPQGVCVDSSGTFYIADTTNHRVRMVASGTISTVAGNGTAGYSGDGSTATSANLNSPQGVALDSSGDLFLADTSNNRVRLVTSGTISTVAGNGYARYSGDGGAANQATLETAQGLAYDSQGSLYFADSGAHVIRKITSGGTISTVAGTGTAAFSGDGGLATSAQLNTPLGIAIDSSDNLYIADGNNNRIRKVTAAGSISTVAGNGTGSYSGDGSAATSAAISGPFGVGVDSSGNIYIGDTGNNRIRKVDALTGVISTVAGTGSGGYTGDGGAATSATLWTPMQPAVDAAGNLYITDYSNCVIRKVTSGGIISTVAGTGVCNYSGDGGAATSGQLNSPRSIALDASGNLYVADTSNHAIRKVIPGGTISTFAGTGVSGFSGDGGAATSAQVSSPQGVAVSSGAIAIADTGNRRIRRVLLQSAQTITFNALANRSYGDVPFAVGATASSGLTVTFGSSTTLVCTVSGTTVTITGLGTCTIAADQAGNASYSAAPQVTQSFTVGQGSQTISFNALSNKNYSDPAFSVSATASSGLTVTFASTTTAVCTVSGSTVTIVGLGTCTITADQSGSIYYTAAPQASRSFTVGKGNQTITFNVTSAKTFGDSPFVVSATASSGLTVTFGSSTIGVCTLSGLTVTIVAAGTCTITADQAGSGLYNAAPQVARSITVGRAAQTISFSALANKTYGDASFAVSATSSASLAVSFGSSTTPVCTVAGTTVTITGAGTCTVTADQAGSANYNAAPQVSQSFTVGKASQTITFNALANRNVGDAAFAVSATASSGQAVTFGSTTPAVCAVSGATVTVLTVGSCSIAANQAGNTNYNAAAQVSQSFSVGKGNQTITFPALANRNYGDPAFTLNGTASSGLPLTFASSNPSVCTVVVRAVTIVAPGTCTITADQAGDANYNAAPQVTQSFPVFKKYQMILFGGLPNRTFGDAAFSVSATAGSGLAVTFASATPQVCTVSGATVTIVAAGTCTITANQSGNSNYDEATPVSQSLTIGKASQTIAFGALANKAVGDAAFPVAATSSSGLTVTFGSSTPAVCTVAANVVTILAAGTCSLSAAQAGNSNYNGAPAVTQSFSSGKGSQTIAFAALPNRSYGEPAFVLSATATSGLPVAFASSTPSACTVAGATVTLLGAGTCTISASQSGNANFTAAANVSQSFAVASYMLRVSGFGGTAVVGQPFSSQFSATGGVGNVAFRVSGLPSGLTISATGLMQGTPLSAGSFEVTITATDAASARGLLTVTVAVAGILTPPALPDALVGKGYSFAFQAAGLGSAPRWSATGILPAGFTLSPAGQLSGTPAAGGNFSFVATASDGSTSVSASFRLRSIDPPRFSVKNLPPGVLGTAYSARLGATGGTPPVQFRLAAGQALPAGLSLDAGGAIVGTPQAVGTLHFFVSALDSTGATAQQSFTIAVHDAAQTLRASASSLSFSTALAAVPEAQAFSVIVSSTDAGSMAFTKALTPGTAPPGLFRVGGGSTTPAIVAIGVNGAVLQQLAAGTYSATLALSAGGQGSTALEIPLSLTVSATAPRLSVSPSVLSFSAGAATPGPQTALLSVTNAGGGTLSYHASGGAGFITNIAPSSGAVAAGASSVLAVTIDPAGLSAGHYTASILVDGGSAGSQTVTVALDVAPTGPALRVGQTGIRFQGTDPSQAQPQDVAVRNSGGGSLRFSAELVSGSDWASLTSSSAAVTPASPGVLTIAPQPGLESRTFARYALVKVTDAASPGTPQYVQAVLDAEPVETAPLPSPAGLVFRVAAGGAPVSQTVLVHTNRSAASVYAVSADGGDWLSATQSTSSADSVTPGSVSVTVNPGVLPVGTYTGQVPVAIGGAVRAVSVLVIVTPASSPATDPVAVAPQSEPVCPASRLLPLSLDLPDNFSATAGLPVPITVRVYTDCGSAILDGRVGVSFSNGDSGLLLAGDPGTGSYSGTWTPGSAFGPVNLTITASASGLPSGSTTLAGAVTYNPAPPPSIAANGVVNAFSGRPAGALAPGSLASVYGLALSWTNATADVVPYPTLLEGTRITIGGIDAPVYFVSSQQVNIQVPFELLPDKTYAVVASVNGAVSTPQQIAISAVAPGVAAYADGRAVVQHSDYGAVGFANPAKPGEVLVMYLTGMGAVRDAVASGSAAPASGAAVQPEVAVGGQAAEVLYAGLVPGAVGLYQINFQVPASAPSGLIPLSVRQGTASADLTTLVVQ